VTTPRVTVLMSVHNGVPFLAEAVESILGQTMTDFEFLVIDDRSTDGSAEVVEAYGDPRIRVVRNDSNLGLTRSLNIGLAAARGELIARQDADDNSHPERLARQVAFLDAHPEIALVGTQARIIGSRGERRRGVIRKPVTADGIAWEFMFGNPFIHSSVMVRTKVIREMLGGYNEAFITSQDYELWTRLVAVARATNLKERLMDFRSYSESVSRQKYSASHVQRVEGILLHNIERLTGASAETERWPHLWDTIVNDEVLPRHSGVVDAPRVLDAIYRRFVERHPGAESNVEIRRSRASILAHISCHLARSSRTRGFFTLLRALAVDLRVAPTYVPRFFARLTMGGRSQMRYAREVKH
jgi:Glycosyl transferase family 2